MKSTIAVCGLIATFIAVQPVFANEKAREHKNAKPAAPRKTAVAPKKSAVAPKKGAAVKVKAKPKPAPPKQPWLGRNVAISESERHVIRWYVRGRIDASKGGKFNGVPQGLAKKVAWFNTLPPGWEKKCVRGTLLPAEVHKHCQPLPHDIIVKLPPPPPSTVLLAVDGRVLRLAYPTYEILDVFDVHGSKELVARSRTRGAHLDSTTSGSSGTPRPTLPPRLAASL